MRSVTYTSHVPMASSNGEVSGRCTRSALAMLHDHNAATVGASRDRRCHHRGRAAREVPRRAEMPMGGGARATFRFYDVRSPQSWFSRGCVISRENARFRPIQVILVEDNVVQP